MKRLKITSVLLSAAMCMSLIATPVSVLADETAAPSESQSTEADETKEPEASKAKVKETEKKVKETEPSEGNEKKQTEESAPETSKAAESEPSKDKETTPTEETVTETPKETESTPSENEPETSKETHETKATDKQEPEETKESETEPSETIVPETTQEEPEESDKAIEETDKSPKAANRKAVDGIVSSGECGPCLTWTLDDEGKLTISGYGGMEWITDDAPWAAYSSSIRTVILEDGVTEVGYCAFYKCTNLNSINLPSTLKEILYYAFAGCTGLKSVTIPGNVKLIDDCAFADCSSITDVYYSRSQEDWNNIDIYSDNDYLLNAKIHYAQASSSNKCGDDLTWSVNGTTLTITGSGNMYDYEYWWSQNKPDTTPWKEYKKDIEKVVFSGNITSIGEFAFCKCTSLKSITVPDGVSIIGEFAFDSCSSLNEISLPNTLTYIGAGAFEHSGLNSIVIPNNVTFLGHAAFFACKNITDITLSNKISAIDYSTFEYCEKLKNISIPDSITEISSYAFCGCKGLTSITIPGSVKEISNYAFSGCSGLVDVTFGYGIKAIYGWAFSNCKNLKSITIPDSVTRIDLACFKDCSSLTSVKLPDSITDLGGESFFGCTSLKSFVFAGSKEDWNKINVEYYDESSGKYIDGVMKDDYSKVYPDTVTVVFDICSKLGHDKANLKHVERKDPTETETGNIEYYICPRCGKYFTDADCNNETTLEDVTLCLINVSNVSNGTVTASKNIAHAGEEITLTVNPDEGYEVTTIKVNGSSISGTKFTVPAENVKVEVVFSKIKVDNTLKVTGKTAKVKYKKLRKKKQTVTCGKMMTVSGAQGSLTYKIVSVNKKKSSFKINAATGAVTVKKKLKKGTYTLKVSVTAAGNENYKPATMTVSFKIKVK